MLGGVVSLGDINLEADNVAFQLEETKVCNEMLILFFQI